MRSRASWLSGILLALLLAGCSDNPRDFHFGFHAVGTEVTVSFYGVTEEQSEQAISALRSLYARLGTDWYPWSNGELNSLNDAFARGECFEASDELMTLVLASAAMEMASRDRFNAGLGRLSEIWGMQPVPRDLAAPPDPETIQNLLAERPSAYLLNWNAMNVCSDSSMTMIDPGGVAKGVLLKHSEFKLIGAGIENAIINLGGDLQVFGNIDGRDAHIGIRSPFENKPIAGMDIRTGEAVMTSGNYERFIEIDGKRYTHIFDPRTGYPVEHTASVTVVDTDPVLADAAATALLVGGPNEFDEIVAMMDLTYALLIDTQGDIRLTPAMAERLHWTEPRNTQ